MHAQGGFVHTQGGFTYLGAAVRAQRGDHLRVALLRRPDQRCLAVLRLVVDERACGGESQEGIGGSAGGWGVDSPEVGEVGGSGGGRARGVLFTHTGWIHAHAGWIRAHAGWIRAHTQGGLFYAFNARRSPYCTSAWMPSRAPCLQERVRAV
eukprot:7834147-Pyramimonas_sp.AAC.1